MSHKISSKALEFVITNEKKNSGADFTIKSIATGKDYTYQIGRKKYKDVWYTHVSVEMGYLNFVYMGTYFKGGIFRKGKVSTPAADAIAFVLQAVEMGRFEYLDAKMDIMHKGACVLCGAVLTDAVSIESGLGPVCGGRSRRGVKKGQKIDLAKIVIGSTYESKAA